MLSDDQAVHVLRALDALDELEAAAFKLVRAELACGPVIDGLIADPLTDWVYVRYLPSEEEMRRVHQKGKRVFIAGSSVAGRELVSWRQATVIGMDAILTDYSLELAAQLRE